MTSTMTRTPRGTRVYRIPDGVEFVVTQWPEPAEQVREVLSGLGTSAAEGKRAILDAGLLLLRVAREQGITDITQVGELLATPGAVVVSIPAGDGPGE